jgi:hypothetical protein
MNMHQTASFQLERPLFVHLSGGAYQHVFELDSTEERAFLVGSSRAADLCIERPGVAAVEFHVERLHGEVWLVPGYRGGGVLVNGAPLVARRRVDQRLVVDLGALSLEVYVSDDEAAPGAARSSSAPRPLPADYGSLLPTDTACTAFAMTPFQGTPMDDADSDVLLKTQPLAVVRVPVVLAEQRTERLAPIVAPPPPAPTETLPLNQTQRLAPVLVPPPAVRPTPTIVVRAPEVAPAPPPPIDSFAALAAQDTTAFDVEACPPVPEQPQRREDEVSPVRAVTAQRLARASQPPRRRTHGLLEQLGLLAKARPGLVLGGGTAAALMISLALVGAMQLTTRRGAPPASPPSPGAATMAPIPSANPVASAVVRPPFVAIQPPPVPSGRRAKAAVVADPDLVAAVGHLAAGRLTEAAQSYQSLSTRAEGAEVYGKLSALLTRRAGPSCVAPAPANGNACPEIVK